MIGPMRLIMSDTNLKTIEQIEEFLEGSNGLEFEVESVEEKKTWIEDLLIRFSYLRLKRKEKGIIRRYIPKVSGYSRAQTERLIGEYRKRGWIRKKRPTGRKSEFRRKYTDSDIELLAKTDELHGGLNGPAIKRIMEREWTEYGKAAYENISRISVSHLYNLRRSWRYGSVTIRYTKTKPSVSRIGERTRPDPQGKPGYIRVDSVHQGDRDGEKGVYHINVVDEVTQWEMVASVEKISEFHLLSVLERMLNDIPFSILGFHSDNGSEFINRQVAGMLDRMLIKLTKSRPRHSNDNGLVESKNGSVIRKHLGYIHIPQSWAERINRFNQEYLNPYINFHRPCFFPVSVIDRKGKVKKTYPYEEVKTPYEKLKSLPEAEKYLRAGITFEGLDAIAGQMSDNEFAERMVRAKSNLFREINKSLKIETSCQEDLSTYPHYPQRKRKEAKEKEMIITVPPGSFLDWKRLYRRTPLKKASLFVLSLSQL